MPEREGDPIAVKNMVTEAKERLLKEFSARDIKQILDGLDSLVQSIDYAKSLDGLAIFVNANIKKMLAFPIPLENRVVIDNSFVTRDILGALGKLPRYWVLSLSEKPTRLFYGLADALTEIIEPETDELGISRDGFPLDYLKPTIEQFGFQQGGMTGSTQASVSGRVSYLDSKYMDDHKKTFFKKVDGLLARFTAGETRPLIILGTEKNIAFFESLTMHKVAAKVTGDFADRDVTEVAKSVWPVIQAYLDTRREKKIKEFEEAVSRGKHAFGLESVWRMAQEGRVQELLVEEGYSVGGKINPENPENLIVYDDPKTPGISDDLVNKVIDVVLEKGNGKITMCKKGQLKDYKHIAAILRY